MSWPLEIQDKCECLVCPCDVSEKSAVISMARNVLEKFGNVDVLVNNAGYGILGNVEVQSVEEIESVTATNYLGMIYCTKAFLSSMLARKNGHIVNVASLGQVLEYPDWLLTVVQNLQCWVSQSHYPMSCVELGLESRWYLQLV